VQRYFTHRSKQPENSMQTKTRTLYQVREFIGNDYSKQLGQKLRDRTVALRLVRLLKKQGRSVFAAPLRIAA
jgi:hypothetical protein